MINTTIESVFHTNPNYLYAKASIMGLFDLFKKKQVEIDVPEWASFFEPMEYQEFDKLVNKYFTKRGIEYKIKEDTVFVETDIFGSNELSLLFVANLCKSESVRYKRFINDHFDQLASTHAFKKEFHANKEDFNYIKQYLGVKLYPKTFDTSKTFGKTIVDEINAIVTYELPHGIFTVSSTMPQKWGISEDELFYTGLANTKAKQETELFKKTIGNNIECWFAYSDHYFTGNIVFYTKYYPKLIGTYGAIVAIPHRHTAVFYPIENKEVVSAVNTLAPIIKNMYKDGQDRLSSQLFYFNEGKFYKIECKIKGDSLVVIPPEELIDVINLMT